MKKYALLSAVANIVVCKVAVSSKRKIVWISPKRTRRRSVVLGFWREEKDLGLQK
jgi:hypothetical protein